MTDPYGIIHAKILDLQGNSIGGQPSDNDWRLIVDNEQLKFQHYDATANGGNGAFINRQSFGNGLTGINVVPQGTYSISGTLQVTNDLTVDGGSLFVDSSTNRVGFGTLTPSQSVHIIGDAYIAGDLTVTGSASITSASWTKVGGTNELYYIGANVGIGIVDPTAQLDVLGTSKFTGDMTMKGHMIPDATNTYDLGSASKTFRHVYVGPGSLYVNGKQVITDDSNTITVSTDINQNLVLKTSGTGNLQVSTTGTGDIEITAGGIIQMKKTLQILDGQKITSSGGTTVVCSNNFQSDGSLRGTSLTLDGTTSIGSAQLNVLSGATGGTGVASKATVLDTNKDFSDIRNLTLSGDLNILGTTTTINSTTVAVADGMFKYAADNAANVSDMGWYGKYIDSSVTYYTGMFRDATDNKIRFFTSTQVEPTTTVDTTGTGYAKADVVVGDVDFSSGTMRGSIIPNTDNTYDIGSAEFKIRDLYVSNNSFWVGDNHKISIDNNGKMKFRKRKTTTMPVAVTNAGGTSAAALSHSGKGSLSAMKLRHWRAYMRTLSGQGSATVSQIFRDVSTDYEEEVGANSWLESSNNVYLGASGNVGIGNSTPSYKLDVTGDINFTGSLRQNGSNKTFPSVWTEASSETYYTGNVGIGNTNPGEKLDVNGGMKIGTATGTANGTIQWTGSELQVRIGGAWNRIAMFDEIPTDLYSFTSFAFTNCGQTGNTGPSLSQCRSTYSPSWTDNTAYFNVTQTGYQIWTVPATATYTIDAYGARSGDNSYDANNWGKGARVYGYFNLTQGDKYMILVGQMGGKPTGDGPSTYPFTTFTFTNCGVTGRTGPTLSQCRSSYSPSWTDNTSYFNVTQTGYQIWTVPRTANYTIDAYGARGGANHLGNLSEGGARILGTFSLTQGDKYMILVGQMGINSTQEHGGSGGGGGTFVVKGTNYSGRSTSDVLIAAGGGGGAGAEHWGKAGGPGQTSNNGTNGGAQGAYTSGGGGGFNNNGLGSSNMNGMAFTNGGSGGTANSSTYGGISHGGFGGGGSISNHPGGGGGGYSGGNAGYNPSWTEGGFGGGSINNGTDQTNTAGNNTGHGKVIITYVSSGSSDPHYGGSGGGGGSFVVKGTNYTSASTSDVLIVAGGGGGPPGAAWGQTGGHASHQNVSSTSGGSGSGYGGGGGAGFNNSYNSHWTNSFGHSFTDGGVGGVATSGYSDTAMGGFGGGGGGYVHPGGGGGGYQGGSSTGTSSPAYGGGSRNNGTNTFGTSGTWEGHGFINITKT